MPRFDIYEGDCLDILPTLAEDSVDLIVTSPPYAMRRKSTYGGIHPDKYREWFLPRAEQMKRVLKPSGSFILNIWEHCEDGVRHPYVLRLVLDMIDAGWCWIEEYIWRKINPIPGGHKLRVRDAWEHLYHFAPTTDIRIFQKAVDVPARWKPENRKNMDGPRSKNGSGLNGTRRPRRKMTFPNHQPKGTDMLSAGMKQVPRERRRERISGSGFGTNDERMAGLAVATAHNVIETTVGGGHQKHPGTFPRAIPEFFIKLFTSPGDMVLDPFAGSGTTLLAAYEMDRDAIGIEIVPEYVELIRERKAGLPLRLPFTHSQ